MKKKSPKKLSLNRESLGLLNGDQLVRVAGASDGVVTVCQSCSCPASCVASCNGTCLNCPPPPPISFAAPGGPAIC
jgi:hypothetical protein